MIKRKVAMVGAAGVGKTSLVRRYISGLFDERYLTTIGVKVDEKVVHMDQREVKLLLWDVAGAEERFSIPMSYIRGAAGCLLVIDGTRGDTVDLGLEIWSEIQANIGPLPLVVVLNKIDLVQEWVLDDSKLHSLTCNRFLLCHPAPKLAKG